MASISTIAIVDDDESIRDAAANLFRSMGFNAAAFGSAEAFLASDAINHAACLIVDVQMPGMDGLKLQSLLVASGCRIPIVVITGNADETVRARALKSGAVCFLTKPLHEGDLLDGLRSAAVAPSTINQCETSRRSPCP